MDLKKRNSWTVSSEHTQDPPWKFWRRLSSWRADRHSRRWSAKPTAGHGREDLTHTVTPLPEHGPAGEAEEGVHGAPAPETSGSLPDVVDRAVLRRCHSTKAPPKPPRLFLFRSPSVRHPRLPGLGHSDPVREERPETEPIYVNAAFGAALKSGLSGNDRIIPPCHGANHPGNSTSDCSNSRGSRGSSTTITFATTFTDNNSRADKGDNFRPSSGHATDASTNCEENTTHKAMGSLPRPHRPASTVHSIAHPTDTNTAPSTVHSIAHPTDPNAAPSTDHTAVSSFVPAYCSLPHRRHKAQRRLTSPDIRGQQGAASSRGSRRQQGGRRGVRGERGERGGHRHILHSARDLLCHSLQPAPLLVPLQDAGVLSASQVNSLRGHEPDRKLVCQTLIDMLAEGDHTLFTAFVEVLRHCGGQGEVVGVLDVMRDVDRLIHDLPHPQEEQEEGEEGRDSQVLAEDRLVTYEVGYLGPDGLTLKPIVELERARPVDRRIGHKVFRISGVTTLLSGCGDKLSNSHMRHSNGNTVLTGYGNSLSHSHSHSHTHYNSANTSHSASSTLAGDTASGGSGGGQEGRVMVGVCVTGHQLSGQRALALAEMLRRQQSVVELRMGKTGLCSADLAAVCGSLLHNSSLASLDIRLNTLDFVGASAVASVLSHTRALRQLNASSTGLDVPGCGSVLSALQVNTTLVDLDLSFLEVGDAVCEDVRDMLKVNTCLQRLRLRSNGISAAGCMVMAEGLRHNRTLLELDLSRNDIGDEGLRGLAGCVPLSSLQDLSLENCNLTSAACDLLAEMTSHSTGLRRVDLSVNHLGDEGVVRLSAGWDRGTALHTVSLNMCGITNEGFSSLLDAVEKSVSIRLLKLCYNRLGRCQSRASAATASDNLRYRLRIVTSSKPSLKILLWGNSFDQA